MRDGKRRWWLATKEDESIRIFDEHNRLLGYLGTDGRLHHSPTVFGHRAYCMMMTKGGDIWIGCKPGALLLLREQPDGNYAIREIQGSALTCNIVYHIVEDGRGRLWLATFGGGIACITNPAADKPTVTSFTNIKPFDSPHRVRHLLVTPDNRIVCATTNGLIIGDVSAKDLSKCTFRTLHREGSREGSLSCNAVMDVLMDADGHVFVATENNGIDMTTLANLFSPQPIFRHFTCHNSSIDSDCCLSMVLQPNGHLLVVCTDRVLDFDAHADVTTTFSYQFWSDVSHFSEERPLLLYDGSWVVGQEQGAYIATRHNMQSRGFVPPLFFTELSISGGGAPFLGLCATDSITLAPDERNFSVSFAALEYSDNSGISYRSRLDGGPWSHAGSQRTLTFHNLAPATYTLEVQSTDKYGRWVPNNRTLIIIVKPYWYETWWAHLIAIILAVALLAAIILTVLHIRALHRQRRELHTKYMALLATSADTTTAPAITATMNAASTAAPVTTTPAGTATPSAAMQSLSPTLSAADQRFLERVKEYIETNISNSDANIDDMAMHAATSRSNLNRKLRSLVGITATQLLIDARMQKAHRLLHDGDSSLSIADIAYQCGYSDPRYFSKCYKHRYGVSPTDHKE
jgi:AraC-like DNA-binding protein